MNDVLTNSNGNSELDRIIKDAMEKSDLIAFKSILDAENIKYDDSIENLDELKEKILENCSEKQVEKVLKDFDLYKNQSLVALKGFDPTNLTKYKAQQTIKTIGDIVSPIAQTLAKSALTIAMYQGLVLLPLPLKLSIAGATFTTKRIPKILKGAKGVLDEVRKKDGVKNISKKVLATVLSGAAGVSAISILNYIAKGGVPDKILNMLPGIKGALAFIAPSKLRKAVLLTTGVVKGVDAYKLRKEEAVLYQPIIKGFFLAKGMKIEEDINSFKDVEKYVEKLDDQGKYEFKEYLRKCVSMKKMTDNPNEKVKKVGKKVVKIVSDAFETASYLSLLQPFFAKLNPEDKPKPEEEPQPEPVTVSETETVPAVKPTPAVKPVPETVISSETEPVSGPKLVRTHEPISSEELIEPEIEADPEGMERMMELYRHNQQIKEAENKKRIAEMFKNLSPTQWSKVLDDCVKNSSKILGASGVGAAVALICQLMSEYGVALLAI